MQCSSECQARFGFTDSRPGTGLIVEERSSRPRGPSLTRERRSGRLRDAGPGAARRSSGLGISKPTVATTPEARIPVAQSARAASTGRRCSAHELVHRADKRRIWLLHGDVAQAVGRGASCHARLIPIETLLVVGRRTNRIASERSPAYRRPQGEPVRAMRDQLSGTASRSTCSFTTSTATGPTTDSRTSSSLPQLPQPDRHVRGAERAPAATATRREGRVTRPAALAPSLANLATR